MSSHHLALSGACAALLFSSFPAHAGGGTNGTTTRVSLDSNGLQVFQAFDAPSLSRDGSRIAFETQAALVAADTNGLNDVYVVDRVAGTLVLASTSTLGTLGNGSSFEPALSGDGRWVAFSTYASNWIGFDLNGSPDVMLKDLQTGQLQRVSGLVGGFTAADGASRRPAISFDGRFVAFDTTAETFSAADNNGALDVYVRDFQLGTIALVSRTGGGVAGNGASSHAALSDDGRFLVFQSSSTNLVAGDANASIDIFERDMLDVFPMEIASRVPGGALGNGHSTDPSISANGRFVVFTTAATNFVFGDANGSTDVFLHDRSLDLLRHVDRTPAGGFPGPGDSFDPHVSADGRFVVFTSSAPGLTPENVALLSSYVRDMKGTGVRLVSRPTGPTGIANGSSHAPELSGDGSVAVFRSSASNLVSGDANGQADIFVRDLIADPQVHCAATVTSAGCEPQLAFTGLPRASQNAGFVLTLSEAPNDKLGLFFYGLNGRQSVPFGNGTMCVQPPVARLPIVATGGTPTPASDCSGLAQIDMNAFAAGLGGIAPLPQLQQVGQVVNVQFWGRDPQAIGATTFLSEAVEYVVGP